METTYPDSRHQSLLSQDDNGLWMRMDFIPTEEDTEMGQGNFSLTSDKMSLEEIKIPPSAPVGIPQYHSVLYDESEDDVFISEPFPPPSHAPPSLPTEGISHPTDPSVNDPSVTVINGAVSVTEAKENPEGLERHHGDRQTVAAPNKVDKVARSKGQVNSVRENMDTVSLCREDPLITTEEDQGTAVETCFDSSERQQRSDNTGRRPGHRESNEGSGEIEMLSEDKNFTTDCWSEKRNVEANHANELPANKEGDIGNERQNDISQTDRETRGTKESAKTTGETEDGSRSADDTDSTQTAETHNSDIVETNIPMLPSGSNDRNSDSNPAQKYTCGPSELCKCNKNKEKTATKEPDAAESRAEFSSDDEEWVSGDSSASDISLPHLPISRGSSLDQDTGSLPSMDEQGEEPDRDRQVKEPDGSKAIATKIQQGEQLLQRLQMVQLKQDVQQESESTPPSRQVVVGSADQTARQGQVKQAVPGIVGEGWRMGGSDLRNEEDEQRESRLNIDIEEGGETSQGKRGGREKSKSKEDKKTSSSTMPVQPGLHRVPRMRAENSDDDDQSDSGVSADFSPITIQDMSSISLPAPPTQHQSLATPAETPLERELCQIGQGKQSLQRPRGLFNLTDNPDVLEIPFKTDFVTKQLPTKAGMEQSVARQFSEQKMQKEISQEIQRELVLVNQGKLPGGYSKGAIRQLKDTKILFETFQQDNMGPTRHKKQPCGPFKDHVYPSVLERTRSLEMLSLKRQPVSRTYSLRLCRPMVSKRESSAENLLSKSPVGGARDSTRLSPYPKQDKFLRFHRSMDSLGASNEENRGKVSERSSRQEPLTLRENPFFKLRPALALQPVVQKDIWEAREREEELRRQRCTLYGETRQKNREEDNVPSTSTLAISDVRQQSKGKLDRIWPPPSKKDQMNSGQTQEPKVYKAGGAKAPLWQRWERGMINREPSKEN